MIWRYREVLCRLLVVGKSGFSQSSEDIAMLLFTCKGVISKLYNESKVIIIKLGLLLDKFS